MRSPAVPLKTQAFRDTGHMAPFLKQLQPTLVPCDAARRETFMSNKWCRRLLPLAIGVATCLSIPAPRMAAAPGTELSAKVAAAVWEQARKDGSGQLDLIVSYHGKPGLLERAEVERLGGKVARQFELIDAQAIRMSSTNIQELAASWRVRFVSLDAPVGGAKGEGSPAPPPERTGGTSGIPGT